MEPIVHTYFDSDALEILAVDGAIMSNGVCETNDGVSNLSVPITAGSCPSFKVKS